MGNSIWWWARATVCLRSLSCHKGGVLVMYSRRDFGKITLAGFPLASALAADNGVIIGVMTYSYRTLPVVPGTDRVDVEIEALKANGCRDIELYEQELQPPGKP